MFSQFLAIAFIQSAQAVAALPIEELNLKTKYQVVQLRQRSLIEIKSTIKRDIEQLALMERTKRLNYNDALLVSLGTSKTVTTDHRQARALKVK